MAKLEVEIGAEIKDLQSKVNQASKTLDKFGTKADKNLKGLNNSAKTAAKGMNNLNKGAISGNSAMTAFSRTIQDAPFGIMGVSNNITNLTEQFGYLKNKTGSAGGALKAMLRDLKGFGGISLLISVATSVLLVWGDKIFATKNRVKELRQEQEDLTKSLDDYVFGLEAVNQSQLKGSKSAVKELTNLRLLKNQVNDTTLSLDKRKGAIEELKKKYPEYLKNMSDEKILNGGLTTVYDTLTTSILKRAKATAATNAIIKNSEKLITLNSQKDAKQLELDKKKTQFIKKYGKTFESVSKNIDGAAMSINVLNSPLLLGIVELNKQIKTLEGQTQNLELSNIDLEQTVTGLGIASSIVPNGTEDEVRQKVSSVFEGLKESYSNGLLDMTAFITKNPLDILPVEPLKKATNEDMIAVLSRAKQNLIDFNQQAKSIITGGIANTFSLLGESIGNPLMNAGEALSRGLGGLLSAMGDFLIKAGTAAVLAGTLNALFGTISGIGAGVAAIAGGVALKAIGSSIQSSRSDSFGYDGGSNAGTSTSFGGNNSRQNNQSLSGGFNGNSNVVFRIKGRDLIGVLSNELGRNRSLGGNLAIT